MSTTIYSANYHPSSISLFHDSNGYYHLIYMIVNKINNKIYIGKHTTKNPYDDYMGSGKAINTAIKKYGLENFEKTFLYCFDSEDEAYLKESEIVDETFVKRSDTYNMKCGGKGFKSCDITGEKHHRYWKGKKRSPETIIKNSISNKGKQTKGLNPQSKAIQKFDLHHNLIKEFECIIDAAIDAGFKSTSGFRDNYVKSLKAINGYYYKFKN